MRALVLGLILINVLYWTWSSSVDTSPAKIGHALDPDLPALELVPRTAAVPDDPVGEEPVDITRIGSDDVVTVDEDVRPRLDTADIGAAGATAEPPGASQDQADESAPSAAQSATPQAEQRLLARVDPVAHPARCVGVGPFASLSEASDAAAMLAEAGLSTSQRVEESKVWVGHWVHLPPYPTRDEAVVVVERLRREGVKDIYIEPSGELKNTISLGLFTELERAEIRAGNVRKLGDVRPQIRHRSRDGLVYWLDLSLDAGVELDTSTLPHKSSEELTVEPVDCPPVSVNG